MGRVEEIVMGRVGILRWEGWRRLRWEGWGVGGGKGGGG